MIRARCWKKVGMGHALATALWVSGWYEARQLSRASART